MGLKKVSKKTLAKKDLSDGIQVPWHLCLDYLLAGRAVVTLVDVATTKRHTYFVSRATDDEKQPDGTVKEVEKDRWFVHVLHGSGDGRRYSYIGVIDDVHGVRRFRTTKGTKKAAATAENINLIGDTTKWLVDGVEASHKIKFWHRGFCARCCAALTVPSSIATGFGPDCAKMMGIAMKKVSPSVVEKLAALSPVEGEPAPAKKETVKEPEGLDVAGAVEKVLTKQFEAAAPAEEPEEDPTAVLLATAVKLSKMTAAEVYEWLKARVKVENGEIAELLTLDDLRTPKKDTA